MRCSSIPGAARARICSMHWCAKSIASTKAIGIETMKICIYGVGAIGGWMGVKLAQAGCEVSAVARGATLAALQQHGLRLVEGGETHAVSVRASERAADLGPQDLVVVAVKAPAMASVAAQIAPLINADTIVLTAMNGVPW